MAIRGEYDIGILMSTDTDLLPTLDFVDGLATAGGPEPEVAAWTVPGRSNPRLALRGRRLYCHSLDVQDYANVADPTDYTRPAM